MSHKESLDKRLREVISEANRLYAEMACDKYFRSTNEYAALDVSRRIISTMEEQDRKTSFNGSNHRVTSLFSMDSKENVISNLEKACEACRDILGQNKKTVSSTKSS